MATVWWVDCGPLEASGVSKNGGGGDSFLIGSGDIKLGHDTVCMKTGSVYSTLLSGFPDSLR